MSRAGDRPAGALRAARDERRGCEHHTRPPRRVHDFGPPFAFPSPGQHPWERQAMTPTTKHRVLVVDDNRDAARTMSELLSMAGFEVETCFDGPSALAVVDRFRPEACLLDIAMPGMDGYELA